MRVQDVMTSPAHSCTPDATLVDAAETMWNYDCGSLPVLESQGRPIGMLTDRDICMAVARKNRFPGDIRVREVMTPCPFVCKLSDSIESALVTMSSRQVRRLPVINTQGVLVGVVSVNDIAAAGANGHKPARGANDIHRLVVEALLAICGPARDPSKKSA